MKEKGQLRVNPLQLVSPTLSLQPSAVRFSHLTLRLTSSIFERELPPNSELYSPPHLLCERQTHLFSTVKVSFCLLGLWFLPQVNSTGLYFDCCVRLPCVVYFSLIKSKLRSNSGPAVVGPQAKACCFGTEQTGKPRQTSLIRIPSGPSPHSEKHKISLNCLCVCALI